MTELPKNGWYVELPENPDEIDLDKLKLIFNEKYGCNYEFYEECGSRWDEFYYIDNDNRTGTCYEKSDVIELRDVTHLFLRKPEQRAAESNRTEPELSESETIEIDGVKYRKIDTNGKFENGDLVIYKGKNHIFIGYTKDNKAVLQNGINFAARELASVCKLEKLKFVTWHYAIYKGPSGGIEISDIYDDKDDLDRNSEYAEPLEYRTFEEQL